MHATDVAALCITLMSALQETALAGLSEAAIVSVRCLTSAGTGTQLASTPYYAHTAAT